MGGGGTSMYNLVGGGGGILSHNIGGGGLFYLRICRGGGSIVPLGHPVLRGGGGGGHTKFGTGDFPIL